MNNDAMRMPKRAIYWNEDAHGWYDLETDIAVKNMGPPEAEWSAKLAENAAHAAGEARQGMSEHLECVYGTLAACATCGHEIQYTKGFAQPGVWMHTDTSILYSDHLIAPIIENGTYVHVDSKSEPHADKMSAIAQRVLDRNVVYAARMYFNADPEDDKLVTVGYMKRVLMNSEKTTYDMQRQLQQRITVLERPWWKRWRNR